MKLNALLAVTLLASALYGQEVPFGTAGGQWQVRQLSHRVAPTYVPLTWASCGTAKIDGVLSPGEWSSATSHVITVNTAAGPVPATLYVMSDNLTLYMALKFPESSPNYGSLGVEFDNDNNGVPFEPGDDVIVENNQLGFFDDFHSSSGAREDTADGGTAEGRGAYVNDGTNSVYEISHPFNTSDFGHDLSLCPSVAGAVCRQTVGFFILLRVIDGRGATHDTYYPDFAVYDQINFQKCDPPVLSGCGTPTIDGIIGSSEWASSGQYRLSVNTTPHGDTTPATLYLMNDSFNLHFGLAFDQAALVPNQQLDVRFDSINVVTYADQIRFNSTAGFQDLFVRSCPAFLCLENDTSFGGTRDGTGALANNGSQTAYELSHPLNSGDRFDVSLAFGDTSTYLASVTVAGATTAIPTGAGRGNWLICTPGAPQGVNDLTQQVNALDQTGALSPKNADSLRKDLSKANANLQIGKLKQASNELGNFINDVTKMMRKGDLTQHYGRPLINAAIAAMSQL